MYPLALVAGTIFPEHLSVAVSLVVLVAALVEVATLPGEHAHAILLVVLVLALVHVAVLVVEPLFPLALSVLQTVLEFTDVDTPVFPLVLALAFWLALGVGACEAVAIGEDI